MVIDRLMSKKSLYSHRSTYSRNEPKNGNPIIHLQNHICFYFNFLQEKPYQKIYMIAFNGIHIWNENFEFIRQTHSEAMVGSFEFWNWMCIHVTARISCQPLFISWMGNWKRLSPLIGKQWTQLIFGINWQWYQRRFKLVTSQSLWSFQWIPDNVNNILS